MNSVFKNKSKCTNCGKTIEYELCFKPGKMRAEAKVKCTCGVTKTAISERTDIPPPKEFGKGTERFPLGARK